MTDARLNEVINQYFPGKPVSATAMPSRFLPGSKPKLVTRDTIDDWVRMQVVAAGLLQNVTTADTLFNFILPPGAILTNDSGPGAADEGSSASDSSVTTVTTVRAGRMTTTITVETKVDSDAGPDDDERNGDGSGKRIVDTDDAASSLLGLGGYHGSVHVDDLVVYFSVAVYSQTLPNGRDNGIVAFSSSWKNIVCTLYHELQEARTDPDVEDANRTNNNALIGWSSDQGEEIGDFPVFEAKPLRQVFKTVSLLNGGGAPIQLMYSNRVHGPEDPTV